VGTRYTAEGGEGLPYLPLLCRIDQTSFRRNLSSKQPQVTNKMTTATTAVGLRDRTRTLLNSLESSGILLVEWETSLFVRLGCPLGSNGVSQNTPSTLPRLNNDHLQPSS